MGAKADIYQLVRNLAEKGISIMLISSELPEILTMSDRVVVMHEGRVTGILDRTRPARAYASWSMQPGMIDA